MQHYRSRNGESGVVAYDIDAGAVLGVQVAVAVAEFDGDGAGGANIARMQELARAGHGLSSFISQHVHDRYARKLNRIN
jgi:hypothetical protein